MPCFCFSPKSEDNTNKITCNEERNDAENTREDWSDISITPTAEEVSRLGGQAPGDPVVQLFCLRKVC